MSEKKWSFKIFDSINSPKSVGGVVNRLLSVLEYLDKHLFDKVSSSNSMDSLYSKIFHPSRQQGDHSASHPSSTLSGDGASSDSNNDSKSNDQLVEDDAAIVRLLCEWAVTTKRIGEYRARVVAKLLERRQSEILVEKEQSQPETSSSNSASDPSKMEVDENSEKLQAAKNNVLTGIS